MRLVVVIPAYNEGKVIGSVVQSLPKHVTGVSKIIPVVVDDNSRDNTRKEAEAAGALCIHHEANLGAGGATVTGLEAAKSLHADIVVTMDGDGQHSPADLETIVRPLINKEVDVVLGSRLLASSEGMPLYKRFGNNLLNIVTYIFARTWVSDSQSGYKGFSGKAIRVIDLRTTGYEFCSEIIGELRTKKLKFKEVPISTIYTDYSKAKGQLALNAINIILGLLLRNVRNTRTKHYVAD